MPLHRHRAALGGLASAREGAGATQRREALPAGAALVQYKVQAFRSTGNGPEALYHINIGTRHGATTTTTPAPVTQPPKAAA